MCRTMSPLANQVKVINAHNRTYSIPFQKRTKKKNKEKKKKIYLSSPSSSSSSSSSLVFIIINFFVVYCIIFDGMNATGI